MKVKWSLVGPVYPWRGGIAHCTALLAEELRRRDGVNVYSFNRMYPRLLFPGHSSHDPSQAALATPAIYSLDGLNPISWLQTAKTIARSQSQAVAIQWWHPYWAPMSALLASRIRTLTHGKTSVIFLCHNILPHESHMAARLLAQVALKSADAYLVHAQSCAGELRSLLPQSKMACVPLPPLPLPAAPADPNGSRKALGIHKEAHVVLFFGLVRPYKGLAYLLDAIALAVRSDPDLHLVIAGEFWRDREELLAKARGLGIMERITLADHYIPNEAVSTYFAAADVLALPYLNASQTAVAQVAYHYNLPVIATCVGGLPDVVHHELTGLLVPPADAVGLARAITTYFAGHLQQKFSENIAAYKNRFTWSHYADVLESLLHS